MLDVIIRYLSNFISCTTGMFIILDFMNQMFHSVYQNRRIRKRLLVFGSIFWFCINFFEIPLLNFSYSLVSIFAIALFFYNAKHLKEVLQLIVFIISYVGSDIIVSALMSLLVGYLPFYSNNSLLYLLNVLIAQTFIIIIIKLVIILLKKQNFTDKYKKKYLFLLILPISNIITIGTISILPTFKTNSDFVYYIIILMTIVSVILNIALIYLFENTSKADQLENDVILMKQQVDMQYNYYKRLEVEYNDSQRIMHDIKNHIEVFEKLYTTNQNSAEGLAYAQKIYDIVEQLSLKFKCNNRILNIIVNEKMKTCELNHIKFLYSVENINLDFISDIDITSLFANILDNAIDACLKITSEEKQIELRLYQFNKMIIINLINTIEVSPIQSNGEYISTKKEHKAIGLSNVKACVNKYNGDMSIDLEQDKFSISIMLPISY